MQEIEELLERGVANIIPDKTGLEKLLKSGKKLNIYMGVDPTATKIHLGHTVGLRKLQAFANLGHNVTFLIGDFTAMIGDTSDKEAQRPALTLEEIEKNFKTYKKQAEKILDFSKIKVRYNSQWLKKLGFEDILKLTHHFSVNDLLSRELIKKRLNEGKKVGLHEFLYPIMQAYDSYFMDTDLQIGGTDQTFNMQAGRTLQKIFRKKESYVLSTPILEGPDGRKMSKSWGNVIWIDENPNNMYTKVMAVEDNLILTYFTLATNVSLNKIKNYEKRLRSGENPISIKKELAYIIVGELHNKRSADDARDNFEKTVQKKELPKDVKIFALDMPELNILEILIQAKLASSNSEAKRLIEQGGVSVDGEIIKNSGQIIKLEGERIIRVGKKNFAKLI